jgi:transketolase
MSLNQEHLTRACTEARGLAMDAVAACKSGHLGLPLGATEIGAILFGFALRLNPDEPKWINRDRFVLSAGHGSMFLYAWLHLLGFDIPIDQIKRFRALHSITPGHPEFGETPGVEATTGPLGQGVGNSVGMAVAAKMVEARFNTPDHTIFDHHIVALCGDGCMQEGVASEAAAYAGRFGLDNLILFYDSNDVTLDAMAAKTQSEDTGARFKAYGWEVQTVKNGQDMTALLKAFHKAKNAKDKSGKPQFIICKTLIGKGIPEVAGTQKAHGEAGVKYVDADRKLLGLPDEKFYVSPETREYFAEHKKNLKAVYQKWQATFEAWQKANPEKAELLREGIERVVPKDLFEACPVYPEDTAPIATRKAGADMLNGLAKRLPLVLSGSADLHGSTLNYIKDAGDFDRDNPAGRNLHFGIREHAMGAICNGIAYHGIFRPSGATFLTFADYMRPSIRLAAIAKLPVFYIFTHDSIGVGEDGPTHQPVELVSALRDIPNLDVIRPGDPEETAGAFVAAIDRTTGPTAICLSRQAIPLQSSVPLHWRREGVISGGYVAQYEKGGYLNLILMATGSELQHAMNAANQLGNGVRVVSMPSFERFERMPWEYRESILPSWCKKRVAIEAGVTGLWYKYVGLEGKIIGTDRFGLSAPGDQVMKELGITTEHLVEVAKKLL